MSCAAGRPGEAETEHRGRRAVSSRRPRESARPQGEQRAGGPEVRRRGRPARTAPAGNFAGRVGGGRPRGRAGPEPEPGPGGRAPGARMGGWPPWGGGDRGSRPGWGCSGRGGGRGGRGLRLRGPRTTGVRAAPAHRGRRTGARRLLPSWRTYR